VLGVIPAEEPEVRIGTKQRIVVEMDQEVDYEQLISNENDEHYICMLVNKADPSYHIPPIKFTQTSPTMFSLTFATKNYREEMLKKSSLCYSLKCST